MLQTLLRADINQKISLASYRSATIVSLRIVRRSNHPSSCNWRSPKIHCHTGFQETLNYFKCGSLTKGLLLLRLPSQLFAQRYLSRSLVLSKVLSAGDLKRACAKHNSAYIHSNHCNCCNPTDTEGTVQGACPAEKGTQQDCCILREACPRPSITQATNGLFVVGLMGDIIHQMTPGTEALPCKPYLDQA